MNLITHYVPNAEMGQIVEIDGAEYRVVGFNLARPHHPMLAPVE